MSSNNKKRVLTNLLWRFFERIGAQGIGFIVSLILARILMPEVYGIVAIVTVFTSILQVFVDSGLGNALIQKEGADDLDFSSVFWFNLVVCLILYILIFLFAPIVASFYNMEELSDIIRVMSLILIISGVKNVQQAYISKRLLFKKFFFATLVGTIVAAIVGIWMAVNGYGVWALVAQNLINQLIDTAMLWILVKWRPKFIFSFNRLKGLLRYGWKLLASGLISTVFSDIRQLVIGKVYSSSDLAYYNQGEKLPNYATVAINSSIDSVLLPTLSEVQNDRSQVKAMTRRAIKTSTYVMMPLMAGLAACATQLVLLILKEKWLPCVFFLRVFCISYAFYPVHTANLNAIKACGRSDIFLKLEVIKNSISFIVLLITTTISVEAMAIGALCTSFIAQIINALPNKRILDYSYKEQFIDMVPQLLLSLFMFVMVLSIEYLHLNTVLTLGMQIVLGMLIYILGSKICKIDSYQYVLNSIKMLVKNN